MPRTTTGFAARYNRASVERALDHHFPAIGPNPGWLRAGDGYSIVTGRGILLTRTLRETYLVVVACAATESRLQRAAG